MTPPPQETPANICINLMGYIFVADSIMGSSENFRTVLSESYRDANPLVAEPETDFNAKWPFKVIQGHLFRYH